MGRLVKTKEVQLKITKQKGNLCGPKASALLHVENRRSCASVFPKASLIRKPVSADFRGRREMSLSVYGMAVCVHFVPRVAGLSFLGPVRVIVELSWPDNRTKLECRRRIRRRVDYV